MWNINNFRWRCFQVILKAKKREEILEWNICQISHYDVYKRRSSILLTGFVSVFQLCARVRRWKKDEKISVNKTKNLSMPLRNVYRNVAWAPRQPRDVANKPWVFRIGERRFFFLLFQRVSSVALVEWVFMSFTLINVSMSATSQKTRLLCSNYKGK